MPLLIQLPLKSMDILLLENDPANAGLLRKDLSRNGRALLDKPTVAAGMTQIAGSVHGRLALPGGSGRRRRTCPGRNMIDPAKRGEAGHCRKLGRRRSTQDARRHHILFFSRLFLRFL